MDLLKTKQKNGIQVLYGFSIGAYLAMEIATKTRNGKIVLVSPAPLFKELIDKIPKKDKNFIYTKNITQTIPEMCKKINCKVAVYVGEKENKLMKETAQKIAEELDVRLNIVPKMGHTKQLFDYALKIEEVK